MHDRSGVSEAECTPGVAWMIREAMPTPDRWCGGCGALTSLWTQDECARILDAVVRLHLDGQADKRSILSALAWPAEVQCRSDRTCSCPPPSPVERLSPPPKGFWVYYLYGESGLLYVGMTRRPRERMRQHLRREGWGDLFLRAEWEEHESAEDMVMAEAEAIRVLSPPLNSRGVG